MGLRPLHPAPAQRRPHGKQQRGVWFTVEDILEIGRMLPELMTARQAKTAAAGSSDPSALVGATQVPADLVEHWATIGLR